MYRTPLSTTASLWAVIAVPAASDRTVKRECIASRPASKSTTPTMTASSSPTAGIRQRSRAVPAANVRSAAARIRVARSPDMRRHLPDMDRSADGPTGSGGMCLPQARRTAKSVHSHPARRPPTQGGMHSGAGLAGGEGRARLPHREW
jgi:hypothetical protein